jgi:lipopolysaccharide/colanic/teichoic acid biosynthesis glycosyltransferase
MKGFGEFSRNPVESVLALILLVLCVPCLLFIAGFIRITSEGPVFITDQWLTSGGRCIRAARFRTTGTGSAVFRTVARLMRRGPIDELPSLWNVVRGEARLKDLSLFKPRRR